MQGPELALRRPQRTQTCTEASTKDLTRTCIRTSGLGVLVIDGKPDPFNHPVVEKLLDLKWNKFGLKIYATMQVRHGNSMYF